MRLLVTGSRDWSDIAAVAAWLAALLPREGDHAIAHGACNDFSDPPVGADATVSWLLSSFTNTLPDAHPWSAASFKRWAPLYRYEVDHRIDGQWPAAGPRRNERMVELFEPTHCLAFLMPDLFADRPRNRGTRNCIELCEAWKVPVTRVLGQ